MLEWSLNHQPNLFPCSLDMLLEGQTNIWQIFYYGSRSEEQFIESLGPLTPRDAIHHERARYDSMSDVIKSSFGYPDILRHTLRIQLQNLCGELDIQYYLELRSLFRK